MSFLDKKIKKKNISLQYSIYFFTFALSQDTWTNKHGNQFKKHLFQYLPKHI